MRISLISIIFSGLSAAYAAPLEKRADYEVHNSHFVPPGWRRLAKPHPDHTITLRIGVTQGSFKDLERNLYEVSDPDHHRYGNHLSAEEVEAFTAPSEQTLNAVHDWLEDNNVRLDQVDYSPSKDWLIVALPVSDVEELLDTEYHEYENDEGVRLVRTTQYSLPRALHGHIDVIQPTNYFGNPKKLYSPTFRNGRAMYDPQAQGGHYPPGYPWHHPDPHQPSQNLTAVCNQSAVTNLCLRTLYNTVDYVPKAPQKNYVATTNYLNETANYSDFHIFLSNQRPDADQSYQYTYQIIANGINFQQPETTFYGIRDVEANLDVQTVGGFVYPTRFTTYSTGGSPPFKPDINTPTNTNEPYLVWVSAVLKQRSIPYTITTSYADDEQSVPKNYAKRVCEEFAQIGARGTTLFFSSGDDGVGPNGTCYSNDGKNTYKFLPLFPPSCPYVTAVGGTRDIPTEVVAFDVSNGYVAGGGLSEYFSRPSYQDYQVTNYLRSIGNLHKGLYNPNGRAYPDIAAQGYRYVITYGGRNILVDGTSASSPCAAGVFTNVNDALIAAGRSPLGFMNPWLYKNNGQGFNDIVQGNIWGCNTSGFYAKPGWDLASGFGTPDFKGVTAALLGGYGYGGYGGH